MAIAHGAGTRPLNEPSNIRPPTLVDYVAIVTLIEVSRTSDKGHFETKTNYK